jgi:hypothetical protein
MAGILPPGNSPAGTLLRAATGAPPLLTSVRSVDEGLVIAAALALSSSAFVLQVRAGRSKNDKPVRPASVALVGCVSGGGCCTRTEIQVAQVLDDLALPAAVPKLLLPSASHCRTQTPLALHPSHSTPRTPPLPCMHGLPPARTQLLSERGETATRAGSATLGVLLMQV